MRFFSRIAQVFCIVDSVKLTKGLIRGINQTNPPYQTRPGKQAGYNRCGTLASPTSNCQNVYINSPNDFCLWGPPTFGGVSQTERQAVAYCTQPNHGTRVIPQGTFTSVHYVSTKHYIQITGRGNAFARLTPALISFDSLGNPIGGVVFGPNLQFEQWTQFLLPDEFCIRACYNGPDAWRYCNHIYDLMACRWNIPADYGPGFDSCKGDEVPLPMGEYKLSNNSIFTWRQEYLQTPSPGIPGNLISCNGISEPHASYPSPT
ncbi:hypothetical protein O181_004471 [Austropuccinia psidii MF-1]|uniref:Uncharacterized protein n=1 Tax=Austropuccinia psidii MF-1 TaxID=1389203 RepID=A0A9Q3GF20_9BASI|nr:hypothetical protein [Austropuccinia psidii MF-1]